METLPTTLLLKDITIIPELDSFLPELDADELGNLEKEIKAEGGIRDPLVIWITTNEGKEKNVLVDGHNRCRIVEQLKKTKTPLSVTYIKLKDRAAAKEWMLNNQLSRRNLDVFTRVQLVLKLEGEIRQRAAERKKKGQFGTDATDSQISDAPEEKGTVFEILGKKAKTSKDTVIKIKKILTGIPRLRELVDTEQLSINQAAEIVTNYQPEEQDAAINRVLTLGKSDQLEEVDTREPRIKGSTGKTFKLKNSYIQFVERADGKPDTSDFIIGDAFFQGVCVRSYGGGMQLVQSQYFLNAFSDEKPLMYDEAMSYLKEVQGYITIAHDLINSGKAVEKAEKKVKKSKAAARKTPKMTDQPKIDQPTKAKKSTKEDQPTKAVKAKPKASKKVEVKKKAPAIKKAAVADAVFQEPSEEQLAEFKRIRELDDAGLALEVEKLMQTELLTDEQKKKIMELPSNQQYSVLSSEIKIAELLKNELISDEKKQQIIGKRYGFDYPNHIIMLLEREIKFQEQYRSEFLTSEEKQQFVDMRNDIDPDLIIKQMKTAIEKAQKKTTRSKASAPTSKKPAKASKAPKQATPTPPTVQELLDKQEQLTDAEKQSLIVSTAHMPEKKQIAAIGKAIENRKAHSVTVPFVQEPPTEQLEQPTEQPGQ